MSVPAKKPRIEILVSLDKRERRFSDIPKNKLTSILTIIKPYEDIIPWRYVLKETIGKYGEPASVIRGSRTKEGMTQVELAKKLGIPQQHISEMENGKRTIGKRMAKRLAKVFNADYRIFL